jgi:23S rRNA (adenine-N6)-dimethyltransferase
VSAHRRTHRDWRRRRLGQNFLRPELARQLVGEGNFRAGELVVEVGAGRGALTVPLAEAGVELVAVEFDPHWASQLRAQLQGRVRVVEADFLTMPLPTRPFRVMGSLPFGETTAILRRLFDNPLVPLQRADLMVQWEVARKRAAVPPATLLSTSWAPWWEFKLGRRIPATDFRPVPRVDAGLLVAIRKKNPLLPPAMADEFSRFVRERWPFGQEGPR